MEKLIKILIGFALLYGTYALFLKRWDYTSKEKEKELRQELKKAGLSSCYFFILPNRLLLFNVLSAGVFYFYWIYKQWQAVLSGYKNLKGTSLKFGPFVRAVFGLFSFYQLMAIVNRTCVYMHKPQALSHLFWGSMLWIGAGVALSFNLPIWARILGAFFFFSSSYIAQKQINLLPKQIPPSKLRWIEILVIFCGWIWWGGVIFLFLKLRS
ncbi:MAG: hypothetical protein IKL48_00870 [Elusimicrobiaceae bacterium]|nr:hypothetical protein [Elusimicrobiaceae bacterium]